MLQAILAAVRALGDEWRADAKRIKHPSPSSEIASTLEGVAGELERLVLHLMIVVLGVVVGGMVVAMYLPIFDMINTVQ